MKKHLLLLILPLLIFTACKKDEEPTPEAHKIVGTWQVTKIERRLTGENWQVTNQPCKMDNTEEYKANGDWAMYDGTDQCSAGTGIMNGTWRTAASDTKVIYTYSGISGEYESTIEELTTTSMILSHSTGALNGEQIRTTFSKR